MPPTLIQSNLVFCRECLSGWKEARMMPNSCRGISLSFTSVSYLKTNKNKFTEASFWEKEFSRVWSSASLQTNYKLKKSEWRRQWFQKLTSINFFNHFLLFALKQDFHCAKTFNLVLMPPHKEEINWNQFNCRN